eukprot:g18725.t1
MSTLGPQSSATRQKSSAQSLPGPRTVYAMTRMLGADVRVLLKSGSEHHGVLTAWDPVKNLLLLLSGAGEDLEKTQRSSASSRSAEGESQSSPLGGFGGEKLEERGEETMNQNWDQNWDQSANQASGPSSRAGYRGRAEKGDGLGQEMKGGGYQQEMNKGSRQAEQEMNRGGGKKGHQDKKGKNRDNRNYKGSGGNGNNANSGGGGAASGVPAGATGGAPAPPAPTASGQTSNLEKLALQKAEHFSSFVKTNRLQEEGLQGEVTFATTLQDAMQPLRAQSAGDVVADNKQWVAFEKAGSPVRDILGLPDPNLIMNNRHLFFPGTTVAPSLFARSGGGIPTLSAPTESGVLFNANTQLLLQMGQTNAASVPQQTQQQALQTHQFNTAAGQTRFDFGNQQMQNSSLLSQQMAAAGGGGGQPSQHLQHQGTTMTPAGGAGGQPQQVISMQNNLTGQMEQVDLSKVNLEQLLQMQQLLAGQQQQQQQQLQAAAPFQSAGLNQPNMGQMNMNQMNPGQMVMNQTNMGMNQMNPPAQQLQQMQQMYNQNQLEQYEGSGNQNQMNPFNYTAPGVQGGGGGGGQGGTTQGNYTTGAGMYN